MKTKLLKSFIVSAGLLTASLNANAADVIYERGTTTAWSEADLADWTGSNATTSISNGLYFSATNTSYDYTKSLTTTENSIVTVSAKLNTGQSTGRSGGYNYFKIGGVELRAYGQDAKATITIGGGEETSITTVKTDVRGVDWTISLTINQATKAVSYAVTLPSGEVTGEGLTTGDVTGLTIGYYKPGRVAALYQTLTSVEISEEKQTVETANYIVKKVCGDIELASDTLSGAVGADPVITTGDMTVDGTKYIYVSNDAATVGAIAEGNVYTVTYRTAEKISYTVKFLNGDEELATAVTGSVVEGEKAYVPYRKYINVDGTLYQAAAQGQEYRLPVAPTKDGEEFSVAYSASDITNVVYFAEAEEIEGLTSTSSTPADVRCSNGLGGYNSAGDPLPLTFLEAGKYTITAEVFGNSGCTASFEYGGDATFDVETVGYMLSSTSDEFTISSSADVVLTLTGSGSTKGLDYVYIQQTATSTGINAVSVEDGAKANVYYNISGQRVAKPSKGLYIQNGKKVIIK